MVEIKHVDEAPLDDSALIGATEWNKAHTLTGTAGKWLAFDSEGDATEVDPPSGGGGIEYTRRTANYTAEAGEGIIADTSGGTWTLTLPATPAEGDVVVIADGAAWADDNLIVARNGSTIEGHAENLELDISGAKVTFLHDGTTWQVYAQTGAFEPSISPTTAIRILNADQTMADTTAVQNWFDSASGMALEANSTYYFEGVLHSTNGETSHNLRLSFDAITGATIQWAAIGAKAAQNAQATAQRFGQSNTFTANRTSAAANAVEGSIIRVWGTIITGAAGTFRPRARQSAASGSFTILRGTHMTVRRLGTNTLTNTGEWA